MTDCFNTICSIHYTIPGHIHVMHYPLGFTKWAKINDELTTFYFDLRNIKLLQPYSGINYQTLEQRLVIARRIICVSNYIWKAYETAKISNDIDSIDVYIEFFRMRLYSQKIVIDKICKKLNSKLIEIGL